MTLDDARYPLARLRRYVSFNLQMKEKEKKERRVSMYRIEAKNSQFWNREYAPRNVGYVPAPKQIGESIWFHARREFRVDGGCAAEFCNAQNRSVCRDRKPRFRIVTLRVAIFIILRFIVYHVEVVYFVFVVHNARDKRRIIRSRREFGGRILEVATD